MSDDFILGICAVITGLSLLIVAINTNDILRRRRR